VDSNRSIVDHDCLDRWGVVLAGGDGKRLLPLTRKLTGEHRQKRAKSKPMIEQANTRAEFV
jgi:mannose-1-phosphate guanylyltransferase